VGGLPDDLVTVSDFGRNFLNDWSCNLDLCIAKGDLTQGKLLEQALFPH
jgi:hypothetical protein